MTSRLHKWLPATYAAVPLLVVAFVLPSALRPPPDSANQGSAYSPDAPPDKHADAIIRSVQQAGSATAGNPGKPQPTTPATPPAALVGPRASDPPRGSRAGCYPGTPPVQLESVYSVPCQPAFAGDNGGATGTGVTRTDITIVIMDRNDYMPEGPIDDSTATGNDSIRTYNDMRKYLNVHSEFYGRQLRFFSAQERTSTNPTDQRADAVNAVEKFHPLAVAAGGWTAELNELSKRKVVNFNYAGVSNAFLRKQAPFSWEAVAGEDTARIGGEWVCKQLKGRPPIAGVSTGDTLYDPKKPRVFGLVSISDPDLEGDAHPIERDQLSTCGITPAVDAETGIADANGAAAVLVKMKNAGVTSVIFHHDLADLLLFMQAADSIGYKPEWIADGIGGMDSSPTFGRAYSRTQRSHLFGLTLLDIPRDPRLSECFRAIRSVDPGYTPTAQICHAMWEPLVHLAGAIQENGPRLNSVSLAAAIPRLPHRDPDPKRWWAMSGGYGTPGKFSFADSASVWWWSDDVTDPDGQPGGYLYADCGHRYKLGTFPSRAPHIYQQAHTASGGAFDQCREA